MTSEFKDSYFKLKRLGCKIEFTKTDVTDILLRSNNRCIYSFICSWYVIYTRTSNESRFHFGDEQIYYRARVSSYTHRLILRRKEKVNGAGGACVRILGDEGEKKASWW